MTPRLIFAAAALLAALLAPLPAQTPRRNIYSTPEVPSTEALRRLNLHLAWRVFVPVDGRRDGILNAELHGQDLYVITRSGLVVRMDAETGRTYWRARVGKPYTVTPFLAVNSRSVYVFANAILFSLDRASGGEKWSYPMPAGLAGPAAVDEENIYIPTVDTRLYAYRLPFVTGTFGPAEPGSSGERPRESMVYGRPDFNEDRLRPRPIWVDRTNIHIAFRPLQSADDLMVFSRDGEVMGFPKVPRDSSTATELYRFSLDGKISVPGAEYGDAAYLGSDDAAVYAFSLTNGKLRWRHVAGTPILRRPVPLQTDLYVTSEREGLARLDRATGEPLWKIPRGTRVMESNPEADRFLAANERFVYATDGSGRLLVLDRKRGMKLSMLDTSAFRVPIVNDTTDRLYLGANDGLILCLHDRDQREPLRHRKALEEMASPVMKRLAEKISEPGSREEMTLRDALLDLRKKYGINTVVVERAFREAGQPDPEGRMVRVPRSENKPLREHLQRVLSQVNATYQVTDQTIFIVPAKEREKEKAREPEREAEREADKGMEKEREGEKGMEKEREGKKGIEKGKGRKEVEKGKEGKEIEKGKDG